MRVCRWNHLSQLPPCDNLSQTQIFYPLIHPSHLSSVNVRILFKQLMFFVHRANVVGKDISLYENSKHKLATSSSMKKPDFKAAIEQIEQALEGNDLAPPSYDVNEPLQITYNTIHFTIRIFH